MSGGPHLDDRLEERLRASLRARAEDVEPTPYLWERVDDRIRRRRWAPALGWALGAAALVLAAVVVVPQLVPSRPGVVVDQPTGTSLDEPAPTATDARAVLPIADAYLLAEGGTLELRRTEDDELLDRIVAYPSPEFEGAIVAVAVRPGSTTSELTAAFTVAVEGSFEVRWLRWTAGGAPEVGGFTPPGFATAAEAAPQPVWSPDGSHLAVLADRELSTIDWAVDGPGDDDAGFGETPVDVPGEQRLRAWVWDEVDGVTASGSLYVSAADGSVYAIPVERQGDGAVALPGGAGAAPVADAVAVAAAATSPPSRYVLTAPDGAAPALVRIDGDTIVDELPVPDDLAGVSASTLTVSAAGGSVLLSDGERVWHVTRDAVRELPAAAAAALVPLAAP